MPIVGKRHNDPGRRRVCGKSGCSAGQSSCAVRPESGGYKAMSPALVGLNPQLPK